MKTIKKIYVREIGWLDSTKVGAWAMGGGLPETYNVLIEKVEGGYKQRDIFYKDEHVIAVEETDVDETIN